ncbi:MAG: hypothetical protein FWF92_06570 [Oscillospiraceae bacterium]|nr:hypothetical protein [Oscillospiraceae bacterium]
MIRNASQNVIGISEKNPHYFQYKGKEILLITSAEHYGAVISKNFDYVKYFDALIKYGLNYTRIYPGAIIEPEGMWLSEDTMAPPSEGLIVPWARSDVEGYITGGNKFDLDKWDIEYFERLRDFLKEAQKRDIIVEICFFNCMNARYWDYSPLNHNANIQKIGTCDNIGFQTLEDAPLVREQLKYIQKIIVETNEFDNIIYEFVDEPTLVLTPSHKVYQWISKMIDAAIETEDKLPKKHILAQQLEIGVDFAPDDRIALIVTQYILISSRQIGGVPALVNSYGYNKPIELNETAYVPSWYDREHTAISRLESWEFMVGGGAGFNQLNGYFVVSNPSGENENNKKILNGLKNLREFLESFEYIKMTRDNDTFRNISIGSSVNMISEKGRQYAIYIHHSFPNSGGMGSFYEPSYGEYEPEITLRLEKGEYKIIFINPENLDILREEKITSGGGDIKIICPFHKLDLAVKIIAI